MAEGLILRPEPDLSEFALVGHTHSQYLTSHQSLTSYATKTYVQQQIAAIDFPDAGVTTFNGRAGAVVPKSGDYTAAMVGAASSSHTHSQYLTSHQDLSGYALKSHTHSQYLTSHQSLTNYATKTYVKQQIEAALGSGGGSSSDGSETLTITVTAKNQSNVGWNYIEKLASKIASGGTITAAQLTKITGTKTLANGSTDPTLPMEISSGFTGGEVYGNIGTHIFDVAGNIKYYSRPWGGGAELKSAAYIPIAAYYSGQTVYISCGMPQSTSGGNDCSLTFSGTFNLTLTFKVFH